MVIAQILKISCEFQAWYSHFFIPQTTSDVTTGEARLLDC